MESYLTRLDDYLTDGFDYLELKVPELRKILQEHNVHYPGNAKKSDLRQIYRNNIIPMIPDIIKSRVNERNVRDNNMSSLSSVTSSPHVQKRTRDDMESSNESQSYLTKNVRTSFSDDSDKDDSMPSNDSLSNVVVQQPTTPNSKRRKTTDNRSNSGTPIVNKVQKKNQSYSADNSNRVSSLPSSESESESEGDHDESISANITNHGKENQNTPTFDFSVNRQAIASSLNEVPTEFRISNSLNIRKDNSSAHTKSYSLIEISDSSDSSGSESDSNNLPPAKMKPLIPIAPLKERYTPITSMQSSSVKQPSSIKQESAPVRQAPILPVKHDTPEKVKDTLNNNSKMGDISTEHFPIKSNSDLNEAGNIVPRNHMTNVQKNREVSVDEPMDTSEENMQEEKYEDEQQREEVELDEEDEIAELEKEINAQREEEEQSAINLDADIDVDNDVPDDSIEYKNLHERMDEELQKEKRKEILEEENKEKFTPELLKGVPKKSTQTKSRSILKTILKLLFKLVLLILTLILLVIPIVLGLWYREQRVSVGYCGFERKCQTFHDIYPTIDQLTYVDSALAKYAPNCIPCPENSICYPYMKIRCKPGYALQKSKLNLFGLIPMSDKCVKDDKRELLVKEMVQKSLEFLRTKNAELMCGESDDDIKSGISQEDLYNIFSESRAPWIDDEEYEKLWQETLQDLQNEPEIIMRQVSKFYFFGSFLFFATGKRFLF